MGKILKIDRRKAEFKLIGAYMPLWVNSYIVLYSLAKGITKSRVIKGIIENWVSQQKNKESDESLIYEMRKRVQEQWSHMQNDMSAKDFRTAMTNELEVNGLSRNYIEAILKEIK